MNLNMDAVQDTGCAGLCYGDVVQTLTPQTKGFQVFLGSWVSADRQPMTWQLVCHSAQECAGHYTLLTVHLSHPKHDWFDCRVCWRGPLSDPQGPTGIHRLTCKVQAGWIQPQHFTALYCTWRCTSVCQMLSQQLKHPTVQATHWMSHHVKSKRVRYI